jgi:excisionase family DNA binding protein
MIDPLLISVDQAAAELGCDRRTLWRWARAGRLTPLKLAGDKRAYLEVGELLRAVAGQPLRRRPKAMRS